MLWKEYYDNVGIWATSTAVSRMSRLESYGPPEEIIDAIETIGWDDSKGATRLLKKAIAAGVKFTGEQLAGLDLICEEAAVIRAIRSCADGFTSEDMDALFGCYDDDVLLEIAKDHNIPLTGDLAEYAQAMAEVWEDDQPQETLADTYDDILNCLQTAFTLLKKAYQFSLIDTARKDRSATVIKYTYLADADTQIRCAISAWEMLDRKDRGNISLSDIRLGITDGMMWKNYLFEGFLSNFTIQKRIRTVMKRIEKAHSAIRKLRATL